MKKSNIKYIAVAALCSVLSSCSLDTFPTGEYQRNTFWDTAAGCEAAVAGCYAPMCSENIFGNSIICEDCATPYFYAGNDLHGYGNISKSSQSAASSGVITGRWRDCYVGIQRCNTVLSRNLESAATESRKGTIEGEARFLRALYYYMLEAYYGDVPLILNAVKDENDETGIYPRADREDVVDAMIYDLNKAYELLPWQWTGANLGRATKGAALALKGKIQIFEASPLVNPKNDIKKWQQAYNTLNSLYNSRGNCGYALFSDYRNLFLPENEHSCECVFNVEFSQETDAHQNSYSLYCVQYKCNAPTLNMALEYEDMVTDYKQKWSTPDKRFAATMFYPGSVFLANDTSKMTTEAAVSYICAYTGFAAKKMSIYNKQARLSGSLYPEQETNYMVIRWADVLLMYAEAINEVNTAPNARCYELVNAVRARAGLGELKAGLTKDQMRDAIFHERIVEFAGEGIMYTDLRRTKRAEKVIGNNGIGTSVLTSLNNVRTVTNFNPGRDYWWPVPQREINLNGYLDQNAGY